MQRKKKKNERRSVLFPNFFLLLGDHVTAEKTAMTSSNYFFSALHQRPLSLTWLVQLKWQLNFAFRQHSKTTIIEKSSHIQRSIQSTRKRHWPWIKLSWFRVLGENLMVNKAHVYTWYCGDDSSIAIDGISGHENEMFCF